MIHITTQIMNMQGLKNNLWQMKKNRDRRVLLPQSKEGN